MLVFTSCLNNYIPKARILASSLKKFHPDWQFVLLLGEPAPAGLALEQEPFDRLLGFDELGIPDYPAWLFKHRVVEICTAAKGPALLMLLNENFPGQVPDKIFYLDPDIMVLNSLQPLVDELDQWDILLTPHALKPQTSRRGIVDNEICSLKYGIYNLGFLGIANRGQGREFASWWRDRLLEFCYDDIPAGLFTDQRWCDMAPAFFSRLKIVRDPGCNAASWNLTDRTIAKAADGSFTANGLPLRFYHFTGYDSGAGRTMSTIYGQGMPAVDELWQLYEDKLFGFGHKEQGRTKWTYDFFANGEKITDSMRLLYRSRESLQARYPDPFDTSGQDNFASFCRSCPDIQKALRDKNLWSRFKRSLKVILGRA